MVHSSFDFLCQTFQNKFVALDICEKSHSSWVLDAKIHLEAVSLGDTIKKGNTASAQDYAKAMSLTLELSNLITCVFPLHVMASTLTPSRKTTKLQEA